MSDRETLKKNILTFTIITALLGLGMSIIPQISNNYYQSFGIDEVGRSWLEIPRESPGLLLVLISGLLIFMGQVKMGMIAVGIGAVGLVGMGFLSPSYGIMIMWLFLYNAGTHMWMPLNPTIGMALAQPGNEGRQLGKFKAVGQATGLIGTLIVWIGFKWLDFDFSITFIIAAASFAIAAFFFLRLKIKVPKGNRIQLLFRREYWLYYALATVNGARKQITITFAPWVLIQLFKQPTENIALAGVVSSILGVFLLPQIGRAIDKLGERKVLSAEAVMLLLICFGYIAISWITNSQIAVAFAFISLVMDRLLSYVGTARVTYLKKIIRKDEELIPTLSMGISMDHVVSMTAPIALGYVWRSYGFQYVFVAAAFIAIINLILARMVPDFSENKAEAAKE